MNRRQFLTTAAVGGATALTSLTPDTDGTTTIHGGSVMTTGAQSYGDAVTLSADATLTSTGGGNVAFAQTLDSDGTPRGLAVNTSGVTSFSGAVGGGSALSSLTAMRSGWSSLMPVNSSAAASMLAPSNGSTRWK